MDVKIKLIQQRVTETEMKLHQPNAEMTFRQFIEYVNGEVSELIKYFRKYNKQLLPYAERHIPLQGTDIFIEALTHYCSLLILSLETTALQIPIIYHALILYKHPSYYGILHKGLTMDEFNDVKHNITELLIRTHILSESNTFEKNTLNILSTNVRITGNYITELFNYFSNFIYKSNKKNLVRTRGKPIPVLDNAYHIPIYYSRNEIFKMTNQKRTKYILIINPYAEQRLPTSSVEYNNDVPDINHIIYDDDTFHGLYRLHPRNWNEPAYELHLFNGETYHILSRGNAEDLKNYIVNKRIDDIPVSIFLSFNIYPFVDNEYVKLIVYDNASCIHRSLNSIMGLHDLLTMVEKSPTDFVSEVKLTGSMMKQFINGYNLKTPEIRQYVNLLNRELLRKSVYLCYPHRNPDLRASTKFRELESKMVGLRKQLNTFVHDNNFRFSSIEQLKKQLIDIVNMNCAEEPQKILYLRMIDKVLTGMKIPIEEADMNKITTFHTRIFG